LDAGLRGANVIIGLNSQAGVTCELQFTPVVEAATWTDMGAPVAGTGSTIQFSVPPSQAEGYFQVVAQ
jgi:hypothetical protein